MSEKRRDIFPEKANVTTFLPKQRGKCLRPFVSKYAKMDSRCTIAYISAAAELDLAAK
ncbi:hypothetical protein [Brevibacillus sp. 1238]|uniref:hypothetical protein n=1 Tax=Brevibacillus sp. 1238 TaxID=2940565 RepID=UPI0024734283|nr:hypothetical protein [Brevibacillus sp. 1238]MDH6350316.1 hypothetical protein [Brevibacillus sp. 1238]